MVYVGASISWSFFLIFFFNIPCIKKHVIININPKFSLYMIVSISLIADKMNSPYLLNRRRVTQFFPEKQNKTIFKRPKSIAREK